ncbi:secreted RxLR effector protein 78-like [Nicotiana sylvestris]|uniref:secreted RxLR effector protein 78-like n=1 Tax=Nicotiana sylvestris TaxID=4096 RepID=UPI00388CB5D1
MKIDMKKAYDSTDWDYMEQVLENLQMPGRFVNWIMKCVRSVFYSIIINGQHILPFHARKGLRQGDPLSPYLFLLAMDYLIRTLKTLKMNPNFNYHPKCAKMKIVQLSFADDLLLFCRGDTISVQLLYQCFQEFSKASGLVANTNKSSIFFGGVSESTEYEIL